MLCVLPGLFFAQEGNQVIRGKVTGRANEALKNATVSVSGLNAKQAVTDSTGNFYLLVAPGKYHIYVNAEGFKSASRSNIMVFTGKQQVQDFELETFGGELQTVTVRSPKNDRSVGLDLWNIQQFAAVFYDPGRVVNSHAGAVNADDGTNHMSVRGTTPDYLQWKVEGVEIVNPNHLENAGTVNDRPAFNGGGVSLISAQLLQNSEFHFSPFDASHGNALSGIFDIRLRRGNEERREHIVQVSLLGIDLCTEGPFSKKSGASYLFNFRYSTIGLLSKMGVNFGDELSNFTDFSHSINIPLKRGSVRIFGMTGFSETIFRGKTDSALIEIHKDLHNIDYRSFTSINGISMTTGIGRALTFRSVAAYSSKEVNRNSGPGALALLPVNTESDRFSQQKISTLNYITGAAGENSRWKAGTYVNYFTSGIRSQFNTNLRADSKISDPVLQPFVSSDIQLGKITEINAGLHSMWLTRLNYFNMQPRITVKLKAGNKNRFSLQYGSSAQMASPFLNLSDASNSRLVPTRSHAFSLMHVLNVSTIKLNSEVYYQMFDRIPEQELHAFSAFNYFNELAFFPLAQNGKAKVYGADVMLEKHLDRFYLITSASVYNSLYSAPWITERRSRFNTGYNIFFTAGRETPLKNPKHFFSWDVRTMLRDGFRQVPVNVSNDIYGYETQLPQYWRVDLRVSYKKNRKNSSVIWALDLQNLTNNRNIAYYYYDAFTGKTETKHQLGLIPVLSYKVMF